MKNLKVKEASVSNINELFTVVSKTLIHSKDTQIFVSSKLFKRLLYLNKYSIIWEEAVLDSFYYQDKMEKALIINLKSKEENGIFQIHFVEYCLNYIYITYFASKNMLYQSRLKKMNTLLIINSD